MIGQWQQRWRAYRNQQAAFVPFYRQWPLPLQQDYRQLPLLALDLELTGLTPQQDQIIAIGAVAIDGGTIDMASAIHVTVAIEGSVGDSAVVHGIRDHDLQQAVPLPQALAQLLPLLSGRLLVCHHAPLDLAFLQQAFRQVYGQSLPLLAVDTLAIERRRLVRQSQPVGSTQLQLAQCRHRYQLPAYSQHHALVDAIACAELLLAQASVIAGPQSLSAAALLRY
ncbi:exonuclease domain-containing protein [uncultured Ferrimonas sp.]|uniref:exonuclease domain-containing protein n=1 Tax=uncultured Ferrimonas sp. TaxID=432640 RepID=UPI00262399CD|nr:exonuclease domain-containing protein [uncultured Ferrimonas sp.]